MGRNHANDSPVRAGSPKLRACLICGGDVEQSRRWGTWNRFCGRSCAAKWMQRQRTPEQAREWGKQGGVARGAVLREHVIERYEREGRQGYWLAYCAGRHALKVENQRQRPGAGWVAATRKQQASA